MSDSPNILHKAFITMNFEDFDKFGEGFSCDEIVFMQYLIFKCFTNKDGEWWHSDAKIQSKLKIGRARLRSIVKRFSDQGWLATETKGFRNNRHYRLDFERLATEEFVSQFYKLSELNKSQKESISEVFRVLRSTYQLRQSDQEPAQVIKLGFSEDRVNKLAKRLEDLYSDRRRNYTDKKRKANSGWVPVNSSIVFTPKHKKQLFAALAYFQGSDEVLLEAFKSYADHIAYHDGNDLHLMDDAVEGFTKPRKDIISYFLSPKNNFDTINTFLTRSSAYGYKR